MKSVVEKRENYAILICQGTYKGKFVIDLDLADEVAKHSWNVNKAGVIRAKIKNEVITLQRFILGATEGDCVKRISKQKPNDMRRDRYVLIKAVS